MSFVSNDGIKIHYNIEGKGPPLVLLHGLSDSIESWYEFGYVERLKDEYQLIMIDMRGVCIIRYLATESFKNRVPSCTRRFRAILDIN